MASLLYQWLAPDAGELKLSSEAFVQVFEGATEKVVGVFLTNGATPEKIIPLLNGAKNWEAKVVVAKSSSVPVCQELKSHGIRLRKVVEREGDFCLRYEAQAGRILVANLAKPEKKGRTRVLIVDDSPTIRRLLEKILASDLEIEVVGGVGLPSEVEEAIVRLKPDVITLDIHLPEMNGVELLRKYLPKFPIPTVMISSISVEEGPLVLQALEAGAVDYIQKPGAQEISAVSPQIILKVKTAASASLQRSVAPARRVVLPGTARLDLTRIVAIGSSTGGTEALREVFIRLPKEIPPIVVVQHIPAVFSKAFADRMNQLCPFEVLEGEDGMEVRAGRAIIAPGGLQMSLQGKNGKFVVRVEDSAPVNRHKPSVDVLMESVAKLCGANAIGVMLTGMGADGAKSLLAMKNAGARTFGQDEASCVVYGMPQAAFKLGACEKMVPLFEMADIITEALSRKVRAA